MAPVIFRSEGHALGVSPAVREDVERTVAAFRRVVRGLCGVMLVHWADISHGKVKCASIEDLFHKTAQRPQVQYPELGRMFGKMPSYLRRAAIEQAHGAVSSFLSNWNNFLDGQIGGRDREEGARPPRLGLNNVYPSLYGGNMILYGTGMRTVQIKLLGADGQWRFSEPLRVKGRFVRVQPKAAKLDQSPSLIVRGAKVVLSCPVALRPRNYVTNTDFVHGKHRICSVDVGINTAATAAIVDSTGTVIARTFLTCGRHNDQRDALASVIAAKHRQSGPHVRGQKHCSAIHRRIEGLSLDAARTLASRLAAFAAQHGAKAFAVEDLKGWKPKGPSKQQRKRFHRFQHRALIQALALKAQEMGLRVLEVYARGTSRWAYDGSGKVIRSKRNAQLATFASGKKYNADLNGALNIAARGLAMLLWLKPKEMQGAATGKSSGAVERMPLVLADIWAHARLLRGASNRQVSSDGHQGRGMSPDVDAPNTAPLGA
ncbi:IS200/IS605 family accessory protein TnpB-related protein [Thiomonas sp. FB-Cd]|uniref:IS200/IS605 family accessory protein TnpB-related protein n=1 Tax=Thiomonas sp. FB-Cd TaxID=1158292 RepID=UPI000691CCD1|nr:IS200/IS605 family accessory protein TnpB-related protein [Thiomonas sp. FB-Cd]